MTWGRRKTDAAAEKLIGDLREANEQMVSATLQARDLTELAESGKARALAAAEEMRESKARYQTLFDLNPVAVYSCDSAGLIQDFNRHAVEIWGREPARGDARDRFCGSTRLYRTDGSPVPHDCCPMALVLKGEASEMRDAEIVMERPDGSTATVLMNVRPVKNARGEITSAINCFYDITARKLAETRLAESLSRERALADLREMFIGILGHDLRNPLAAIDMATGLLLRRGPLAPPETSAVARIVASSQRMTRMIAQLLDFTRTRLGGGVTVDKKPGDLGEICRAAVAEMLEPAIQLQVAGELSGAFDADALAQVLSNLIGNAVEYAEPRTVIVVRARAEGADAVVEVENEGDPIPPEALSSIFEPFRRARQKSERGNLGLGLYIAREIVAAHGGTLQAASDGRSTKFTMRLPRGG